MNEQSNTVINPDKADSIATFQLDLIYINDILVKDLKNQPQKCMKLDKNYC